jgi:hypothetical protein
MEITRFPDWDKRLTAYIESRRKAVFSYGANDCGLFALGAIEAITGQRLPVAWSSEAEAQALISEHGSIRKAVTHYLGPSKGALCARRGDIVIDADGSIGVCTGARVATPTPNGLGFVALGHYKRSWRIG